MSECAYSLLDGKFVVVDGSCLIAWDSLIAVVDDARCRLQQGPPELLPCAPLCILVRYAGTSNGLGEAGVQKADSRTVVVAMEGLGLQGTSCLEALRLSFQIACLRCTKATEVTFSSVEVSQVCVLPVQVSQKALNSSPSQSRSALSRDFIP